MRNSWWASRSAPWRTCRSWTTGVTTRRRFALVDRMSQIAVDAMRSRPGQLVQAADTGRRAGRLAVGGLGTGVLAAGVAGVPAPSPQHTSALAWQVCSSKTMKLRNSSHFTSFLPTVYFADALFLRPGDDVLVEQVLGVLGRAVLAVVVDREGKLLARRCSRRHGPANCGGRGQHDAGCSGNHELLPRWSSSAPNPDPPIAARRGVCLVHHRYAQGLQARCHQQK